MEIDLFKDERFYISSNHTYPPLKDGYYLEEYFLLYIKQLKPELKMNYLPILYTNIQTSHWFNEEQIINLSEYIHNNFDKLKHYNNENKNFTVCQHDDGPMVKIPDNTYVFAASFPENCKLNFQAHAF